MASTLDPAKRELTAPAAAAPIPHAPSGQAQPPVGNDNSPVMENAPGIHPEDFTRANRIHVK